MSYRDTKKPQPETIERIEKINELLQSSKKTVRRLFYMIGNVTYGVIVKNLVWARLNGLISWEHIMEESRQLEGNNSYNNPEEFLESISDAYVKSKTPSFKVYFEVWLEKATLRGVFYPITNKYDVGLLVGNGVMSWTALHKASRRLTNESVIIYFGDNDKHGIEMYERYKGFLAQLGVNPTFVRPALTDEQEKKYKFPKGEHHLDGMPEDELAKLLEASIQKLIDVDKFNKLVKQETIEKTQITENIRK